MRARKVSIIVAGVVVVAALVISAVAISNHNGKKTVTVKSATTNSQGEKETTTKTTKITKATDIKSTLTAWKASGLTVSDDQGAYYQTIGASNGGKYDIGSTNVELYEFSDTAKAESAKTSYFTSASDTVIVSGTLLVDIHSTDTALVDPIKAVL